MQAKATEEFVTAANAFITEIDLPPTLRKIGNNGLFSHFALSKTLRVPRNVETLMTGALNAIGAGTSIRYTLSFETGSKLKSIGADAVRSSRLKDFRLPENLETIGSSAFYDVTFSFSAEFSPAGTLTIPAKVSKIGNQAFARGSRGSSGITTVDIRSKQLDTRKNRSFR